MMFNKLKQYISYRFGHWLWWVKLLFVCKNGLVELGWIRSVRSGKSVDRSGRPVPWIAYPALSFLDGRVTMPLNVFEYGSGSSTLWWAQRVASVTSIEHDLEWYEKVISNLPSNAKVRYVELAYDGAYARAILDTGPWDVVVVDGRDRVNCIRHALTQLSKEGVLVLDNSDRSDYAEGIDLIKSQGFRQLPFVGLAPLVTTVTETSVFYRPGNCLNI